MYLLRKTIADDYVSFETARLLKEAGFDWPCEKWFELKGCTPVEWGADARCNWNVSKDDFSRPTLSLAAKWLREVKNIHIQIYCTSNSDWGYMADIIGDCDEALCEDSKFPTYERAMEVALEEVLEWICRAKS